MRNITYYRMAAMFSVIFMVFQSYGQSGKTLAEKLGYEKDAKLLIIHADDAGMCNAENMATQSALESGSISSTSVMVPCPWSNAFAAWVTGHPDADVGIHLTLTAEWDHYRWDGVLPADKIPSLLDEKGYFPASDEVAAKQADLREAEAELSAQVDRAIALGIKPTHLDSHMGTLFRTPELFQLYLKLGKEYRLPVLIPKNMIVMYPQFQAFLSDEMWYVDNLYMMNEDVPPEKWTETYEGIFKDMKPGLNELIVHLGKDNDELQAVTENHPAFDAAWRQRDFDFVSSDECKAMLEKYNLHMVTWREIKKATFPENK
ncbi:MAG: ChbG/HpnK family deacetylase [Chlorobi bacterium]|nr:ChbG/HpnK family deacetylase [Chlorobiota bacterium]